VKHSRFYLQKDQWVRRPELWYVARKGDCSKYSSYSNLALAGTMEVVMK